MSYALLIGCIFSVTLHVLTHSNLGVNLEYISRGCELRHIPGLICREPRILFALQFYMVLLTFIIIINIALLFQRPLDSVSRYRCFFILKPMAHNFHWSLSLVRLSSDHRWVSFDRDPIILMLYHRHLFGLDLN